MKEDINKFFIELTSEDNFKAITANLTIAEAESLANYLLRSFWFGVDECIKSLHKIEQEKTKL